MHNPFIEPPFKQFREGPDQEQQPIPPAPSREQRRAAARWARTQRRKAERRAKL